MPSSARRGLAWWCLWLGIMSAGLPGCAAQQRRTAGITIGVVGGLTTMVGLGVASGCNVFDDEDEGSGSGCDDEEVDANRGAGLLVAGAGLAVMAIGALLYATGNTSSAPPPASTQTGASERWPLAPTSPSFASCSLR